MADYSINAVTRRVVYSGSAGTGPYAFSFEILATTDVAVYKNSAKLTLTTDYTVTINANGTGSVTLVSAATGTDRITIIGARAISRTTDFVTAGDLLAVSLNEQLDANIIMTQQLAEENRRTLKAPPYDPAATEDGGTLNMTLPTSSSRAGKVLAFNATTGNPEAGPSISAVQSVANASADIDTVAGSIANVDTVASNIANVNTVAGVSANVTTVAGSISKVNTVADDLNEAVSEINTVATNIADVNTVGTNISNVTTVAGISANVTSVAGNATNINTVAGAATNINTVATNISNVNTVATNIADIQNAEENADAAAASALLANDWATKTGSAVAGGEYSAKHHAQAAASSATSAASAQTAAETARDQTLSAFDSFDDRYLGSKASDPAVDNDGNALVGGALYFNTTDGVMKVYTGSAWVAAYASLSGALLVANNLSDLGSVSTARTNLGLGSVATESTVPLAKGGTNATDAAGARTNLGLGTAATMTGPSGTIVGTSDTQTLTNKTLTSPVISGGTINGAAIGGTTAAAGSFTTLSASGAVTFDTTTLVVDATNDRVGVNTASPGSALDVKGTLRLSGGTSGYVGLAPAAAAGSTTYTLPAADGTSGQMLSTNGSGALSWATAGGGFSNLRAFTYQTGTYTRSGTLVTCTVTGHGLTTGDSIVIDFITGGALDGTYTVTVSNANSFTVTTAASGTISSSSMAITGYNWVIPTGVTKAKGTVVGGGGGSGGAQSGAYGCITFTGASSGGGGGGAAIKVVSGLTPGNTITITVGAGGTAGASAGGAGGTGGTSSFGSHCSATGGSGSGGSSGNANSGGSGGIGSSGDLNVQGGAGGSSAASSSNAVWAAGGSGGSSILGGGGPARTQSSGVGTAGGVYGGGGGGSVGGGSAGAAGGNGVVIVEW